VVYYLQGEDCGAAGFWGGKKFASSYWIFMGKQYLVSVLAGWEVLPLLVGWLIGKGMPAWMGCGLAWLLKG
jgi:hypothetical protein